jgi:hypothetical protein
MLPSSGTMGLSPAVEHPVKKPMRMPIRANQTLRKIFMICNPHAMFAGKDFVYPSSSHPIILGTCQ